MKRTIIGSWSSMLTVTLFSLILLSCNLLDDDIQLLGSDNTKDVAITSDVSDKGVTYAEIYGFVNLDKILSNPRFGIEISEFEDFDTLFSIKVFAKELEGNRLIVKANNLNGDTKYYYRTFVIANGVSYYGNINSFKTNPFNNITKTGEASNLAYTSVLINCTADTTGLDMNNNYSIGIVFYDDKTRMNPDSLYLRNDDGKYKLDMFKNRINGFRYVLIPFDSIKNKKNYNAIIRGLQPNQSYYYCSFTAAGGKMLFGEVKNFKTKAFTEAQFSTVDAQDIMITSATLKAKAQLSSVLSKNCQVDYYIRYSTSQDSLDKYPGYKQIHVTDNNGTISTTIGGLKSGKTYYYCLAANIYDASFITVLSQPKIFTTKLIKDYLSVNDAKSISFTKAILSGKTNLSSLYKSSQQINYRIRLSTSPDSLDIYPYYTQIAVTKNNNTLSGNASNLNDGKTYYYCLEAIINIGNSNEHILSEPKRFNTLSVKNYLTVGSATSISFNYATINATSTLDTIYSYIVAYAPSPEELMINPSYSATTKPTTGAKLSIKIRNLKLATTYYYKVLASANNETLSSEIKSFTTQSNIQKNGFIDLGLNIKWSATNLGASVPEDYGNYYSWGETNTKSYYTSANYKLINNDNISATQYDPAKSKLGNQYRMPTQNEFIELMNRCDWQSYVYNNTPGYAVIGNGNAIFIPAAGYINGSNLYSGFYYWTSTQYYRNYYNEYEYINNFENAYYAAYGSSGNMMPKYLGLPIRPVTNK